MEKVQYGTQTLKYELLFAQRKSMAIEVHPDQSIRVIAPVSTSFEEVKTKLLKRGKWILKQQDYFGDFLPRNPKKEYFSGESHFYLGRRYTLKIRGGEQNFVKMNSGALNVQLKQKEDISKIKSLLTKWYYDHAKNKFEDEIKICLSHTAFVGIEAPTFEIRKMKNRWGSCTSSGKILLNPEIIKAPKSCLRYVIYHELCHLIVHSHSKRFYRLLDEVLPDWKKSKERLERELA